MTLTLRPATLADLPALAAFAAATFPDAAPAVIPRQAVASFIEQNLSEAALRGFLDKGSYSFTLALDPQGQILAYAGIDHQAPQPPEVPGQAAYLSKFYLLASSRGSGLAQALLQEVKEQAKADGRDGLYLGTHQENRRAQAFYEKSGFRKVGRREFELTAGVIGQDFIYYIPLN